MALNFPLSPSPGDSYSANGTFWEFDGLTWNIISNNPTQLQILTNVDNVTNSPDTTPNLFLQSVGDGTTVGTGTYIFDTQVDQLQQLTDVDMATNAPLLTEDLVLVSLTNGQFGFKLLDNVASSYLAPADINVENGVQAYNQNLASFVNEFTLPIAANNGFLKAANDGTITLTANPFAFLNNWTLSTNGNNDLLFTYNGTVVARLKTTGEFSALNDVVAFETSPIT